MTKPVLPTAVRRAAYPVDPDFPQLEVASDPERMLEIFRAHLKPISGKGCEIEECIPVLFRCRQSTSRCVLQYLLRVAEPGSGRRWEQWVTGVVYAREGEAERLWRELRGGDPVRDIPESWLSFEPVDYIPELQMLVQVFPYDRKLPNLRDVMCGISDRLEPLLLGRLGSGEWSASEQTLEPARYRTELGAILKHTFRARDARTARTETLRCYLKVYRDDRGRDAFELLESLSASAGNGGKPYSVVRPIAYLDDLRTLALEEAPGVSLQQALREGADHAETAGRVARAVAAFNQDHDLSIMWSHSRADQFADVNRKSTLIQWACPEARADVEAVTAAVVSGLPEVAPMPIHRDLKPDHIFLSGDRVVFIDLDSVVRGDPVRDPAHLYAHLAARIDLDSLTQDQAVAAATAFAEEYFNHVPKGWRDRFSLHCAGALIEVAGHIFKRQVPQWRAKTATAIDLARNALSGNFA